MAKNNVKTVATVAASLIGAVKLDSYSGSPIIVFGADANHGKNLSFGRSKAGLMLDAINTHGVDSIIAMLMTVAGRDVQPTVAVAATPAATPVKAARADTATVTTPTVAATPAATVKASKPKTVKAESAKDEKSRLIGILQAGGAKMTGLHFCKLATLRARVDAMVGKQQANPTVAVAATAPATAPATTVAESNAKQEVAAPHIVHRAAIDGRTFVLFSDGVTKHHIVRKDGKDVYRKTDIKLVIPTKPAGKTVLRTFRDNGTMFVLYADNTWASDVISHNVV